MILFFDKQTGSIIGTIEGRIHPEYQLKAHMGSDQNDKIVCQWKKIRDWIDEDGDKREDWEPDNVQKDIFIELDKHPFSAYQYKVDVLTKQLVKI